MPRPPLQVDDAGLLRIVWALSGTPYAVNVYGLSGTATTTPTPVNVQACADAIIAGYGLTPLQAIISNTVTIRGIGIRSINDPNRPEIVASFTPAPGGETGNILPLQVCACVTLRTDFASRRGRGRSYVPGFTVSSNIPGGQMHGQVKDAVEAWVANIDNSLQGQGWKLAVISKPVYVETPPDSDVWVLQRAALMNDVTQIESRDNTWDTQRRRLVPGI
jgi:hypothetical protein